MNRQGLFITFEGIDGAGKSTQLARLQHRLEHLGQRVVCTREPGGTALGDSLRQLLLQPASPLTARAEALLFAAARAQLLAERIRPALTEGAVVLCDRYVDASLAYQGAGLGLGYEAVAALNRFATEGLRPHLTVLLDVPVEVSQARLRQRHGTGPDRIEQRGLAFFERVRTELLRIAAAEPDRVVVFDGTAPLIQLEQEIWQQVANRLGQSSGQGDLELTGRGEWP
ncbi:MAG: dTMP kinase [Alicyclobacillus sp.]|nr:dTMP kinase [Alicyclobacillus sp.]